MFCLAGETKILTENGYMPIEDLNNKCTRVYTFNDDGSVSLTNEPVLITQTDTVTELIEIEMENEYIFRCTPEHRLLLSDGTYKQAKDLTINDDLQTVSIDLLNNLR